MITLLFALQLYYGISTCSTTLATVFIVISVVTPAWETIRYNKSRIMAADLADPDVEVEWQNNSDWCTVSRTTYPSATDEPGGYTDESPVRTVTFVPLRILAGLWKVCDTLDGKFWYRFTSMNDINVHATMHRLHWNRHLCG